MKSDRERRIESCNHTGEELWDFQGILRRDYEAALVEALDETLIRSRLDIFREFVRRWRHQLHWQEDAYLCVLHRDAEAWVVVHSLICELRRMAPRYEYSANWLLQRGIRPGKGFEEIYE